MWSHHIARVLHKEICERCILKAWLVIFLYHSMNRHIFFFFCTWRTLKISHSFWTSPSELTETAGPLFKSFVHSIFVWLRFLLCFSGLQATQRLPLAKAALYLSSPPCCFCTVPLAVYSRHCTLLTFPEVH